MDRLLTSVMNEWRLLSRDRAGLLMLFLMPALLVIVVSTVQMNVLKTMGDEPVALLWVDQDQGDIPPMLRESLAGAGGIVPVDRLAGLPIDEAAALARVAEGDYQVCLVIPPGFSKGVRERARTAARSMLGQEAPKTPAVEGSRPEIVVHYDPLSGGAFRSAVSQALQRLLAGVETRLKLAAFAEGLPGHLADALEEAMGPALANGLRDQLANRPLEWDARPLIALEETFARRGETPRIPTAVQQNVPAWGLFGIFFIALPLSGALVRERASGIMTRLRLLPVSLLTLLSGKLVAYVGVCLAQFTLMLLIGRYVMPLLGASPLAWGQAYGAIAVVLLCVALAASAFGLLLGVAARTYEQASMIGAIAVVIAAAIGGVMVPVFAMPRLMRDISQMSPLAWGLDAFLALFAREGDLSVIWPQALKLLGFALGMLLVAWIVFRRQRR
ncbi:MAG: ABC transporter permease [Desulfobacterales bacterium]